MRVKVTLEFDVNEDNLSNSADLSAEDKINRIREVFNDKDSLVYHIRNLDHIHKVEVDKA